jgi:hypothetical protein
MQHIVLPKLNTKELTMAELNMKLYLVGEVSSHLYNIQEFDKNIQSVFCSKLYLSLIISWNPHKSTDIVVGPVVCEPKLT